MAWIIFAAIGLPLLGFLGWLLLSDAIVRIEPGRLGLLLVHGRSTDTSLLPGAHFVPAFRRRMVVEYPSLELTYRAVTNPVPDTGRELERTGPAPQLTLGDRSTVTVSFTVRFRLQLDALQTVHDRFGPDGFWPAVADECTRTIRDALAGSTFGIDDLFGTGRADVEAALASAVTAALDELGFDVRMFALGDLDLGPTGEVIQATLRARLWVEREEAEAALRLARVRNDAELHPFLTNAATDAALRYREVDVWRDVLQGVSDRSSILSSPSRAADGRAESSPAASSTDATTDVDERVDE